VKDLEAVQVQLDLQEVKVAVVSLEVQAMQAVLVILVSVVVKVMLDLQEFAVVSVIREVQAQALAAAPVSEAVKVILVAKVSQDLLEVPDIKVAKASEAVAA
jgi:hypothetical protein